MKQILSLLALLLMGSAHLVTQPALTSVILPRYIQGNTGTNSDRIPFAYRVRITGLTSNATYRFYNQIIVSTDKSTTDGAGNCIFTSSSDDFIRTSSPGMTASGAYGSFLTDGSGTYEGWFVSEPTGNASRFIPGKFVFMRIMLNDGASGTTVATRLTTSDSVQVLKLNSAVSDSTGTGLRCTSQAKPKDFVFLYDNTSGTGRPVSGSFIESDGTVNSTANNYSLFYATNVDNLNGAFGVLLPNILPTGIRRIEQRSSNTGTVAAFVIDPDGIWPSGANTVNPSGGTAEIVLTGTDVKLTTGIQAVVTIPTVCLLYQNYPNPFNPVTKITYSIPGPNFITLNIFDLLGREIAQLVNEYQTAGTFSLVWDASAYPSGLYFCRLQVRQQHTGSGSSSDLFTETKKLFLLK